MTEKEIKELIKRYIAGECSSEEETFLERWYAYELQKRISEIEQTQHTFQAAKDEVWKRIVDERWGINRRRVLWPVRVSAAAVVLLVGFFLFYLTQKLAEFSPTSTENVAAIAEVLPGGSKAVLTMADGKQVILTDEIDGVIKQGNGFIIRKQEDGLVSFEITGHKGDMPLVNNTINTPKGGTYRVVLPDGSEVWLNSASSISFPSRFSSEERKVAITGEVYFEVQKEDQSRPFRVETPQQHIEVLGTKFNINAYEDEPYARTSLIEGSVKVKGAESEQILMPGFEMITTLTGSDKIGKADIEAIMAWKEGVFQFDRVNLEVLMRQLARWYDIEVVYQGIYPKDEFVGKIKRNEDIQKVLEILKYGNVEISLDGRKLMVGQKTELMKER